MDIFVSNLSFQVESIDLKDLFTPFGEVTSSRVVSDRETGRSRGFGFVEMPSETAANEAISKLNGSMVNGRPISVTEARPKAKPGNKKFY